MNQQICLPAFAIGGIDAQNLSSVLAAGATRIAVSGAIWQTADPATAARKLRDLLEGHCAHTDSDATQSISR